MALKLKLTKKEYEKLSDELKAEYKEDGEAYALDVDGLEDTGALKRAKDRETQLRKDAEGERDELREEVKTLEKGKAGDVTRLQKKWDTDKATMTEQHTAVMSKRDGFIVKQLKTGLAERLAAALNPKAPKVFVPHLEARITVDLTGEEPKLVILGPDGKPSVLTPEQLQQEFVANKDFSGMIVGSKASGGAGVTNNKPRGGAVVPEDRPASLATMKPSALAAQIRANKEAAAGT
jgi:hypothetical protein